jgi:alpha-galactosidase
MSIIFDELANTITLHTNHTAYQMLIDKYQNLLHLYYGKSIQESMEYLITYKDRGFSGNPYEAGSDRTYSLDVLPQEYSCFGTGDYRSTAFGVKDVQGSLGCSLKYKKHIIENGKYGIKGLPTVHLNEGEQDEEAQTLCVVLEDELLELSVELYYGVLPRSDVITRSAVIKNHGKNKISITKVASMSLDYLYGDYDVLHFHGRHGMERNLERSSVITGRLVFDSIRGTSSHQQNPFFILADKDTTEDAGNCYGMGLLYSGNFKFEVEKDQYKQTRVLFGIQNEDFEYELEKEESFQTPEVVCIYSEHGLTELSHRFHAMTEHHICQRPKDQKFSPILINNWEATYFQFDRDKILEIASKAADLGVEMFVLDDGWFGKRDSDSSGLGDWFVNEDKMKGTLKETVDKIHDMGMQFGLWIEPEMVSEDSILYQKHPDYAFTIPNRKPIRGRYQLVLDFSRKEVVDCIFDQLSQILDVTSIEYIKMDMNRSISDVHSATKTYQNQGKILYEYVLGVYDFLDRIHKRYPAILVEGCSGGGGRFDFGMLYYTPQIWCSDNTDAVERLEIQYGTSFGYPVSTVGAHVSAVPNHQTGRVTDIHTRAVVAMAGTFGYELDVNALTTEEKEEIREQIHNFKEYRTWMTEGKYYRLNDLMSHPEFCAWQMVSMEKDKTLISVVMKEVRCNGQTNYIRLKGLDKTKLYQCLDMNQIFTGAMLMYAGFPLPVVQKEYQAFQFYFKEVKDE